MRKQAAEVVDLRSRRAAQAWRSAAAEPADAPARFFCKRCGSDLFVILESGRVNCGRCAAEMRNLKAGVRSVTPDWRSKLGRSVVASLVVFVLIGTCYLTGLL